MRQLIAVLLLACGFGVAAAAAATTTGSSTTTKTTTTTAQTPPPVTTVADEPDDPRAEHLYIQQILRLKRMTWRWERLMGVPRTMAAGRDLRAVDEGVLRAVRAKWQRFHRRAYIRAHNPPHLGAWLCIHRYEGAWTDAGAPYYGGLQMDWGFMRTYGGWLLRTKGPANNWTPLEQMWVAERAYRSGRGFYPWPNTARYCGLI
jgi:hypothetical protein